MKTDMPERIKRLLEHVRDVKKEHQLLFLAKVLFNPTTKELVNLSVADLQRMVRRRLPADIRGPVEKFINLYLVEAALLTDSLCPSSETDRIVKSRNYRSRYPVSRQSVWRWMKETALLQVLAGKEVAGVLSALALFAKSWWAKVLAPFPPDIQEKVLTIALAPPDVLAFAT